MIYSLIIPNYQFFVFLYTYIRVFFHEPWRFTGHRGKGEAISLTFLYHFHPLHRHLDITQVITQRAHLCT